MYKIKIILLIKLLIILSFTFLFTIFVADANDKPKKINNMPKANKGFIDLSEWDFDAQGMIKLDGEWEFYWNKFIMPKDFANQQFELSSYIQVPSFWNNLEKNNPALNIKNDGFATYRLRVKLKNTDNLLAIRTKTLSTAYSLWINGKLICESGKPGNNKIESIPSFNTGVYTFHENSDMLEIVLLISNFHYYHSGVWNSIILGLPEQTISDFYGYMLRDTFTFGGLAILMIYYLSYYFFRKKDISNLLFALVCFSIILRNITGNEPIFSYLFGNKYWQFQVKLVYLGITLTCIFYPMLLSKIFSNKKTKIVYYYIIFINIILSLLITVTPARIYTFILPFIQFNIFITVMYCVITIFIAFLNKEDDSKFLLVGVLVFATTTIQDLLYHMKIINTFNVDSIGFLIFLLFNALVLAKRFSNTFDKIEDLSSELQIKNNKILDTFEAVNKTSQKVNILIENIYNYSNDISVSAKLISSSMLDNSECIQTQTDNIGKGVASIKDLVEDINSVLLNAENMNNISTNAMVIISEEGLKMKKMIEHINNIDEFINQFNKMMETIYLESNNINKIVEIVNRLSKQTKLLSINASIEASKAQKHGKGFSVIASEIKKLSDSTQDSLAEIKQFIDKIKMNIEQAKNQAIQCVEYTKEGEIIAKEATDAFKEIESTMLLVKKSSYSIEDDTKKVLDLADTIFNLFKEILDVSNTIASSAQEVTASAESQNNSLDEIVSELKEIISHVKFLNETLKS